MFPYPVSHGLVMSENHNLLTCPFCGRQVQLEPFQIIVKGDMDATHWYENGIHITNMVLDIGTEKDK